MRILIDFYDSDSSNNIMPIISVKPDRVLFLYDKNITKRKSIDLIFKACSKHLPDMQFEVYTVDSKNIYEISDLIARLISPDHEYMIDLSGGLGLMQVAGYRAGTTLNISMLHADMMNDTILDVIRNQKACDITHVTLEDYLTSKGAYLIGTSHLQPEKNDFKNLGRLSKYIFRDIKTWSTTCRYMQVTMAGKKSLMLRNKATIRFNQRPISPDRKLLELSQKLGFIKNLVYEKEISFQFTSPMTKQYLTNYGIWLELFVYMEARKLKEIKDLRIGAMIDWDDNDGIEFVGNEIDVVLSKHSRPIFISCKLTDIDTATINEIVINTKRVGGTNGKGILVTFSNIKSTNSWNLKRATDMGIKILDKDDIMSGSFDQILERTIDELLIDKK